MYIINVSKPTTKLSWHLQPWHGVTAWIGQYAKITEKKKCGLHKPFTWRLMLALGSSMRVVVWSEKLIRFRAYSSEVVKFPRTNHQASSFTCEPIETLRDRIMRSRTYKSLHGLQADNIEANVFVGWDMLHIMIISFSLTNQERSRNYFMIVFQMFTLEAFYSRQSWALQA